MRKLFIATALLLAVAGGLWMLGLGGHDITEPPAADIASPSSQPAALSHIALPISIPLAELASYANQKIPEVLVKDREHKRYKKRALGIPITIKGRFTSLVKRTGPVTVGRHGNLLELQAPLFFEMRFKGSDPFDPDVSSKGRVRLKLRLALGMNEDWQPTLKVYPRYQWLGKPRLKLGPFRLDAKDVLGEALEDRLEELARELEKDVRESAGLKANAAARWHELHQVRQLGGDDSPAWLMVDPQAAYFAPVQVTDTDLELQFALAARLTTLVGEVLPPPVPKPLPALIIGPPPEQGFRIQLPVSLNYAGLEQELRQRYSGKPFSMEQGEVTPEDFRIYSAGDSLVLGAKLKARAPGKLLNSNGWVYLQGRPVYDNESRQLQVVDLDFTRRLDNWLVSGASWLLQENLREHLGQALHYDFSAKIEAAKASIDQRINRPVDDGFHMQGQVDDIRLGRIQTRAEDLLLLLDAAGQLAISTSLHAPQGTRSTDESGGSIRQPAD